MRWQGFDQNFPVTVDVGLAISFALFAGLMGRLAWTDFSSYNRLHACRMADDLTLVLSKQLLAAVMQRMLPCVITACLEERGDAGPAKPASSAGFGKALNCMPPRLFTQHDDQPPHGLQTHVELSLLVSTADVMLRCMLSSLIKPLKQGVIG